MTRAVAEVGRCLGLKGLLEPEDRKGALFRAATIERW